jgi:uncharacterized membrane protein
MAKRLGWSLIIPGLLVALWVQFVSSHSVPWWAFISVVTLAAFGASVGLLTKRKQDNHSN